MIFMKEASQLTCYLDFLKINKLSSYYGNVPLIQVKNKHPVEVVYLSGAQKESFESILRLIFEIHHSGEKGDIVVFLACEQVSK